MKADKQDIVRQLEFEANRHRSSADLEPEPFSSDHLRAAELLELAREIIESGGSGNGT